MPAINAFRLNEKIRYIRTQLDYEVIAVQFEGFTVRQPLTGAVISFYWNDSHSFQREEIRN